VLDAGRALHEEPTMNRLVRPVTLLLVVGWAALAAAEEIAKPASAPASQATPAPPPSLPAPPAAAPIPPAPSSPSAIAPASAPPKRDVPPDLTLLRVDIEDGFAIHPWLYHEFRLTKRWGILGDVHAQTPGRNDRFPPYIEIDVGPVLHLGDLQINPQIGVDFTWKPQPGGGYTRAADFIIELYLIYTAGRINAESWNLYFIPFDSAEPQFYLMRQLVDVRVAWQLSLGPHVEGTFIRGSGTDRIAVGGDLSYAFSFGTLRLFLASERMRGVLETRLTFIREL
jgi:hypothetical protein